MFGDFDPRDVDSRERDDGIRDREDQYFSLGRAGGGLTAEPDDDVRSRDDDARDERDRDARNRHDGHALDPRDVFARHLDLPDGHDRELVRDRDRQYSLNGSESRTLASAIRLFGHAARETLATPLPLSNAEVLPSVFRDRLRRRDTPGETTDPQLQSLWHTYSAPRFRALFRMWQHQGDTAIWNARSGRLRDMLQGGQGRVEFVKLTRQYCHLSSLVGVA